ncbi:hypothetical protein HanRHA438_Chr11g0513571 [Helianthus annuus]|nr:hypothetical protein HanRHA438_Chr11g0513571 [Helianthus annuus]
MSSFSTVEADRRFLPPAIFFLMPWNFAEITIPSAFSRMLSFANPAKWDSGGLPSSSFPEVVTSITSSESLGNFLSQVLLSVFFSRAY